MTRPRGRVDPMIVKPPPTPVVQLFELIDKHAGRSPRTKRGNTVGLEHAADTAIVCGFRWELEDAATVSRRFRVDRGQYHFDLTESHYTRAVGTGNLSACRSLERHLGRDPWLWPNEIHTHVAELRTHADTGGRLAVASSFVHNAHRWYVTSIGAERMTICRYSYDPDPNGGYREKKLEARMTCTRDLWARVVAENAPEAPAGEPSEEVS